MAELIQELTGCSLIDAHLALRQFNGNVVDAVEFLVVKPRVRGDAYLPPKPKIDNGLTPEQEELCRRGRDLQDKVNAVVSVAHSKIQDGNSKSEYEAVAQPSHPKELKILRPDELEEDVPLRNPPPSPQCDSPPKTSS